MFTRVQMIKCNVLGDGKGDGSYYLDYIGRWHAGYTRSTMEEIEKGCIERQDAHVDYN